MIISGCYLITGIEKGVEVLFEWDETEREGEREGEEGVGIRPEKGIEAVW